MLLIDRIVYALCLLAPWSLLWLDSSLLFPYTTGKTWVFRALVELAFVLSLVLTISRRRWGVAQYHSHHGSRVLVYVLTSFLAWTLLCNMLGLDAYRSFWSNWERMGGFIDYIHWALYLFCLLSVMSHERTRPMLFNLVLIISLVCLTGIFDAETRSISTLGNPIYVGNLAVFGIFISIYLFAGRTPDKGWKSGVLRLLLALALMIAVAAVLKSASRGPMVALAAGSLVLLISIGLGFARRHSPLMAGVFILACVAFGSALISQTHSIQKVLEQSDNYAFQRLSRVSLSNQTTADRLENWRIAADAAQSRPWMGWGQENYMIAFNQHYRPGRIDRAKLWFDRAHNAYLDVLVASGVPGLLLYCLMMGLPLWLIWCAPGWSRLEKSSMLALFTAFLLKNVVGFDTFSSSIVWIVIVAIVLVEQKQAAFEDTEHALSESFLFRLSALVLLALSMLAIYGLNIRPYQDNQRFATLMNHPLAVNSQPLIQVLAQPVSSYRYAHNSKLAVFDSLLTNSSGSDLDADERQRLEQVFQRAVRLVNDALITQPENYRIKYNGALLAAQLGQYETAIRLLEELTEASPKRAAFWHTLAQVYAAKGRDKSALLARETAAKLNPDWKP